MFLIIDFILDLKSSMLNKDNYYIVNGYNSTRTDLLFSCDDQVLLAGCSSLDIKLSRHTAVLRKVVGRNLHTTIPKGNMGYDQYTVRND